MMTAAESIETTQPESQGKPLDRHLGNAVRQLRIEHALTLAEVSERAGISRGMLSKIENGLSSTSLETLEQLANALGVTIARLFQGYNLPHGEAQFVKSGHGLEVVRRGTKIGHTYHLLAYNQGTKKLFEPFLISIENPGEEFPHFEHEGVEFIYMLEGVVKYRIGDEVFTLEAGDSLTFRGDTPHRPEELTQLPIHFLAVIHYETPISNPEIE